MTEWARVYKFYPLRSALRNLNEKRLKVSMISELNDPFEFLGYRFPNRQVRTAWEKMRSSVWNDKGLICFSESWSNPVLWSHYADKHKGLALGFDVQKQYLHKIDYIRERLKNLAIFVCSDRLWHPFKEPCRCRNSPPFPAFVMR